MTTRPKEEISYKKAGDGSYKMMIGHRSYGFVKKSGSKWVHNYEDAEGRTRKEAAEKAVTIIKKREADEMAQAKKKRAERQALDRKNIKAIRTGDWEENAINWLSQLTVQGVTSDIGWEVYGVGLNPQTEHLVARIEKEGVKIKMEIEPAREARNFSSTFDICGHVDFEVDGSWFTFDRRGISDSFYCQDEPGFFYTVDEIVEEQLKHIQESIERKKRSVAVPSLPYSVTPEVKSMVAAKLKAGQSYMFTPAGMGVAHQVSCRNTAHSAPGSAELAEFFGVDRVFITTQDWD